MTTQPYKWMKLENDKIILTVKVVPNSSKNLLIIDEEYLKVKITAPPVDNKANGYLIEYFSKLFKTPKSSIEIISGKTSKSKRISLPNTVEDCVNFVINSIENC